MPRDNCKRRAPRPRRSHNFVCRFTRRLRRQLPVGSDDDALARNGALLLWIATPVSKPGSVKGITATGPPCEPAPPGCERPFSTGIIVLGCSGVRLLRNNVSNHAFGLRVDSVTCPGGDAACGPQRKCSPGQQLPGDPPRCQQRLHAHAKRGTRQRSRALRPRGGITVMVPGSVTTTPVSSSSGVAATRSPTMIHPTTTASASAWAF